MIDLSDVTFIIPVRLESKDREFNFKYVMKFLCDNFKTNIIIKESDTESKVNHLLPDISINETKVITLFEKSEDPVFHRTRFLNEMLHLVRTSVAANYDIDVFLKPETYIRARNRILQGYDLVYPFAKGESQVQVAVPGSRKEVAMDLFSPEFHSPWQSLCGHCQFFNVKSYREGFMENENFMSYGAEDRERMVRFEKLGYKVMWLPDEIVYHIEHSRGANSSTENPFFQHNEKLYRQLLDMSKEEMIAYYHQQEYLKKYPL